MDILKVCSDLIQEAARSYQIKVEEDSQRRIKALYDQLNEKIEKIKEDIPVVCELDEELNDYTRNLGIVFSGKLRYKITILLSTITLIFPDIAL